jgi:hypothetical protein
MRAVFFFALALTATSALAQETQPVEDSACVGAFTVLGIRAKPELKARMDAGYAAAGEAWKKAHPNAVADGVANLASFKVVELTGELRNGKILPEQIDQRANACEKQYGLPVTDFAKLR